MRKFLNIKNGKAVHLRQGELDGACVVYSLMMGLIATKSIKRDDILSSNDSFDRRTGLGHLADEFFYKIPKSDDYPETLLLRNGYTLEQIQDKLYKSYGSFVRSWYASCGRDKQHLKELLKTKDEKNSAYLNKDALISFIAEEIDKYHPVELGFRFRGGGGHAVLAVGYEKRDGDIMAIYCLDPSLEAPSRGKYNNVIELRNNGRKEQKDRVSGRSILIDEVLSFEV